MQRVTRAKRKATPSTPTVEDGKCRCCLSSGVFTSMETPCCRQGLTHSYTEMLREAFGLTLAPVGATQLICGPCEVKLREAIAFKEQIQQSEETILKLYEVAVDIELVKTEEVEIKHEPLLDFSSCSSSCQNDDYLDKDSAQSTVTLLKPKNKKSVKIPQKVHWKTRNTGYTRETIRAMLCLFCGKKFKRKKYFEAHKLDCGQISKNLLLKTCQFCPASFDRDKKAIATHVWTEHNYKTEFLNLFTCDICQLNYKSFKGKINHIREKHHKCRKCSRIFRNMYERDEHALSHDFPCFVCKESLPTREARDDHKRRFHGTKCVPCNEYFTSNNMRKHKIEVHGASKYNCGACDKSFYLKYKLELHHRAAHMLEKEFSCPHCDFKTAYKERIPRHMVCHSKDRNFTCRFCFKTFPRAGTLKFHERIHTGDKRQVCKFCQQAFVQRASLKYHYEKHHPNDVI